MIVSKSGDLGQNGRVRKVMFILAMLAAMGFARADWDVMKYAKRDYVTLRSFCDFYSLPYQGKPEEKTFRIKNDRYNLLFQDDSREMMVNGVRCWLSFSVVKEEGDWLISQLDVVKLLEPLMRPHLIEGRKAVRGVVIDPGHGGSDNGARNRRGQEKNYTLDTARRLEKILKEAGIPVVMTRRTDVFVDLYERASRASRYDGSIFVSLHYNDAGPSARGLETYCLTPRGAGSTQSGGGASRSDFQKAIGNDNDLLNVLLAGEVHKQLIKLNPGDSEADRGVKRARFVVLKQNQLPSILVEGGFLSNREEAAKLDSEEYREKVATAVARGIQSYMKLMGVTAAAPKPVAPKPALIHPPAADPTGEAVKPSPTSKTNAVTVPAPKPTEPSGPTVDVTPPTEDSKEKATNMHLQDEEIPTQKATADKATDAEQPEAGSEGKKDLAPDGTAP